MNHLLNIPAAIVLSCSMGGVCSCTLTSPSTAMRGKILVLEHTSAPMPFLFPESDVVSYVLRHPIPMDSLSEQERVYPVLSTEIHYNYNPQTKEFYEESRVTASLGKPVADGYGYSKWQLNFSSADKGTATLTEKHPWALKSFRVGQSIPFHLDDCPHFIWHETDVPITEEHTKELLYHHLYKLPKLGKEIRARVHQWDALFIVVELSEAQQTGTSGSRYLIFACSPFGTLHLCCQLLADAPEGEALLASLTSQKSLCISRGGITYNLPIYPFTNSPAKTWRIAHGKVLATDNAERHQP
ncbi:MAG: hypothetical protein IKZ13_05135 [Akkermansia sp.]|nr:hypothetical protein [Akkermansia sp.]